MSFIATDPCTHNSNNTWFTPMDIISLLGPFDVDVCTTKKRPYDIASQNIEIEECNSLEVDWCLFGKFVWMNPPYGKEIDPFIEKFKNHNNGIALVFARMGAPWMQSWVREKRGIFFLRKRIAFIDTNFKKRTNAGADSCLLYCGDEAKNRIKNSGLCGVFFDAEVL